MRILVVTPLFPPDTAPAAHYAKELVTRLSREHDVTALLYGHLPEAVPNTHFLTIDKRRSAPRRLWQFLRAFLKLRKQVDVVMVCNGPSVEIPLAVACSLTNCPPLLFIESDQPALLRTKESRLSQFAHDKLSTFAKARVSLTDDNATAGDFVIPEIHPLKDRPEAALGKWNELWETHTARLLSFFS